MCNWKLGNENFWIENLDFERYLKLWKRFFFWVDWVTELTQLWYCLSVWGPKFWPPHFFVSLFSFLLHLPSTFSSSIGTIHLLLPLIFLLYFIISSYKKHFSKFLNSPSSISINISLDLCVLSTFIPHPFWWNPYPLSLHQNGFFRQGIFFSSFSW